ncbi:hypothetical protein FRAAL4622 [Frankia alni ACN14a]|uniref:Uncharacterized protein n=1 Tax=Frankia alni (strain DSM 45986 / CECT 9034 / ACN14a) TaxID=326424 RepID=Q0RGX2_FRAAA|nr:hypothetical protein FRAAL4622 [Frankia alni ACN14a]
MLRLVDLVDLVERLRSPADEAGGGSGCPVTESSPPAPGVDEDPGRSADGDGTSAGCAGSPSCGGSGRGRSW